MSEPHVLRFDASRSARENTFYAEQLPSGTWKLSLHLRFGSALPIHVVCYAHEPFADGKRRRDPEGQRCLLIARVSEDVYRLESSQLHSDAPRTSLDLLGWAAPDEAA